MVVLIKRTRDVLLIVTLGLAFFWLGGCAAEENLHRNAPQDEVKGAIYETVAIKGQNFNMELALNNEKRASGLMGREYLADDEGMLFVFPAREPYPAELRFWMKNCLIPIDVIFVSLEGVITAIHEMEPPLAGTPDKELLHYSSIKPAQFAIEIRRGLARELGLEVGEQLDLRIDYLLRLAE